MQSWAAQRDRLTVGRLLRFHRCWSGRWKTPTGEFWQPALALEAVLSTYEHSRDPAYLKVVERSFARYSGRRSRFYDDDGWYLNAWLRAYDRTGDRRYLGEAEALFTEMTRAWDDTCGGGLWWSTDRDYKNAITNELFILAAARLHRRAAPHTVERLSYGDWALRAWRWFDGSGMINEDHMVNDGLDRSCANNGQTTWTYNQGVILGALAELWRISGDEQYVRRAEQIADATIAALVSSGGILTEACEPYDCNGDNQVFKGIFVQGLANLYSAVHPGKPEYRAFLVTNADTLWQSARHGRDGFGLSWAAPTGPVTAATQTAAALLTGAVALLPAVAES